MKYNQYHSRFSGELLNGKPYFLTKISIQMIEFIGIFSGFLPPVENP